MSVLYSTVLYWIKLDVESCKNIPSGFHYVKLGMLGDKIVWNKKRIIEYFSQYPNGRLYYLDESNKKNMIRKFKKKPVEIEAMHFYTDNFPVMDAIVNWCNQGKDKVQAWHNGTDIYIHTLEGEMRATVGDFVIKGVKGEFYPCKPDVFEQSYDEITDISF